MNSETSKKEVLILIPGMDGTGILFEEFLKTVPQEIEAIPVKLPSCDDYTYQHYADHVVKVLEEKALLDKPITIVAESFGGRIAYELLNNKVCNIKRVIFAASFLSQPSFISRFSAILPLSIVKRNQLPDWLLKVSLFASLKANTSLALFKRAMQATSQKTLSNRLALIRQLAAPNKTIAVPVIYLQATKDFLVSNKAEKEIKRLCEDYEMKKIRGGHFILQSNPEACWSAICEVFHN